MKKSTLANNFIYYLFCGFSGAVIACIVWLFLKLMSLGISCFPYKADSKAH